MSYSAVTDFLALLRNFDGGVRTERMPGLDFLVAALARAGIIYLSVSDTAPTANQTLTAWFRTASPSWVAEGTLFLWDANAAAYVPATPALWSSYLIGSSSAPVVQDVLIAGPVAVLNNATVVRVNQAVSAPITLNMPLSSLKTNPVLISDWKGDAGANPIRVQLTGADVFPGGFTFWDIGSDAGSIFLRPVPGGYAL